MILAALVMTLSPVQAPAAAPRPCTAPVHRQFDFWVGAWDVIGANGKFAGTNRIELVDGGCALFESWSSGGGGYTGRSLNSVGGDDRWRQTWVDSGGLRLELVGGLVDGKMVLEGETPPSAPSGPPAKNRITWSPETEGRVRQHWETSADGGKTYTSAFDGMYHPVKGTPSRATGFLRTLTGGWIGTGAVMKREAHVELTITPVLGERFVRLQWMNNGGKDGRQPFEGLAIYEERADGTSPRPGGTRRARGTPSQPRGRRGADGALGRARTHGLPPAGDGRARGDRQREGERRQLVRVRPQHAQAEVTDRPTHARETPSAARRPRV